MDAKAFDDVSLNASWAVSQGTVTRPHGMSSLSSCKPLEPREGEPRQPKKAFLGATGPYWEDLLRLPQPLMAYDNNNNS